MSAIFYLILIILSVYLSYGQVIKWIGGTYFFYIDFLKAYLGDDMMVEPCVSVKGVSSPMRNLGYSDYWRLQRCLGNEAGFELQGQLLPSLTNCFSRDSLFLYLVSILTFYFYIWPTITKLTIWTVGGLLSILIPTAVFTIPLALFAISWFMDYVSPGILTFMGLVALVYAIFRGYFPIDLPDVPDNTPRIDPTEHQRLRDELSKYQEIICQLETNVNDLTRERDEERRMHTSFQAAAEATDSSVKPTVIQQELKNARKHVNELLEEKDAIELKASRTIKAMQTRIDNLQSQVNWAKGAGEERSKAMAQLETAQIRVRQLIGENEKFVLEASQLRKELAYEKVSGPKGVCYNDAKCQNDIRRLQHERDLLLLRHDEHEQLVREALSLLSYSAISKYFGDYLLVPSFIRQATLELLKKPALGLEQEHRTEDIQLILLQANLAEERRLNHRLKDECERLGGNVDAVELGLDTRRPVQTRTEQITYEEEAHRVFEFYTMLTTAIGDLQKILEQAGLPTPSFNAESPRNDQTSLESGQRYLSWKKLTDSNTLTNPTIPNSEILSQKLVLNEMQRWYNYGLLLAFQVKEIRRYIDTQTLDPTALDIFNRVVWIENHANAIFNEIGKYVLDDVRQLAHSNSDRALQPRQRHKFKIYLAMQRCITELTHCILENKHIPPPWEAIPMPDYLNIPLTTIDNLTANLVNYEIFVLECRINQLVRYAEETRIPGTNTGPPQVRVQGDTEYEIRWNKMVLALSYSELAVSHWKLWNDQRETVITDPQTGQMRTEWLLEGGGSNLSLLPLQWDDFRDSILGKMQPGQKILEEGMWPEQTQIYFQHDPSVGPRFRVQVQANPAATKTDTNKSNNNTKPNTNTNTNTNNNTNTNTNTGFDTPDQVQVKKNIENQARRIEQLKRWVQNSGLQGSMVMPNLGRGPRKNESLVELTRRSAVYDQHINALMKKLKDNKIQIPKAPHKGGPMYP